MPGDDTAVRVVTGAIPVRLLVFYPWAVTMTHLPQVDAPPRPVLAGRRESARKLG